MNAKLLRLESLLLNEQPCLVSADALAAMTSMGLRLPNSSRSVKMMRASLERPPSFMEVLNACMLMTMQQMSGLCE